MLSRGTCTDRNWGKNCPQLCLGDNNDQDRGAVILFLEEDKDDNNTSKYCCDALEWNSDTNAMGCPSGANPFTIKAGKAMIGAAVLEGLTLIDQNDYNADGINVSQINSTTGSSGKNGTSTTGSDPTQTACVSATNLPGTSDSSEDDNSDKEAAIGAGVGTPLGVIALASLVWAFWLQKQNRELKKAAQAQVGHGQFKGGVGYGGQSGMMMPSSGYMSHGPVNSGHQGHFVALGEMEGGLTELPGTAKHGP
ncbi:uncharacterized protein KD926_003269 [Aspergillus affinis]|uniref:uncharacterized protein n=1 Tax=Aspergillus affinis TaxID=1070780 RepID=UPI0022FE6526|nr:uncharacterized protein KD926_003269 [Aspergillus affinis]KAI9035529.1 hypothetical protein KD926_003269 [Aspergillus affinis]